MNKFFCAVPDGQDWPVLGRDEKTGRLILRPGFIEAVEDASGLERGGLSEKNLGELLVSWYFERIKAGLPRDKFIDALIREEVGFLPNLDQDKGGKS